MLKLKKIINTVIVFIILMFVICFLFSLYKLFSGNITPAELISETGLYFLYTIGYGALEGDAVIQNILAMIGIISVALMTTFLTINLFWRLDDVKFNKEIICDLENIKISFKNKGKAICDMKATFVLYDSKISMNILEPQEYYMPIMLKNSLWNLEVSLNETFWYKAIYSLLTSNDKKLYCIFSFVDTKSGQESIKVEEIKKENLNISYDEFIEPVIFKSSDLLRVENGGKLSIDESINYSFKKKDKDDSFVMLYYNFHNNYLNLEKYNKDTTYLELDINTSDNILLNFEIKLSNGNNLTKELLLDNKKIKINLSDYADSLEEITEICYTIFKKNNELEGTLKINDLKIITK